MPLVYTVHCTLYPEPPKCNGAVESVLTVAVLNLASSLTDTVVCFGMVKPAMPF